MLLIEKKYIRRTLYTVYTVYSNIFSRFPEKYLTKSYPEKYLTKSYFLYLTKSYFRFKFV